MRMTRIQNNRIIYNHYKQVYRKVIKTAKNLHNAEIYLKNYNKSKGV